MNQIITDAHHYRTASHEHSAKGWPRSIFHILKQSIEILWAWHDRASQRRQLARLTSHQLKDIGVSKTMAAFEADKPFWKA